MRIVFREEATADLYSIIAYYEEVAPEALANILSDIYRSIDQLTRFSRIAMAVPDTTLRRLVTRKYHFKVAYEIDAERILIVGIYRHQNRIA